MALDTAFATVDAANQRTLAGRAFTQIHEAIVTGKLAPGERLPIEELASQLGMSPMPIREALRQLHNVGLVENVPHRGASVTQISIDELQSVYEARLALEPLAVRYAAERRIDDEVAQMNAAWETLDTLGRKDPEAAWGAHRDFHFALYEASHSDWLGRLIAPLWESSERYRLATPVKWTLERRSREHEAMLRAVEAGDGDRAATILYDHLATTANQVAQLMEHDSLFELRDPAVMESLAD